MEYPEPHIIKARDRLGFRILRLLIATLLTATVGDSLSAASTGNSPSEGLSVGELVGEALFREIYALDQERSALLNTARSKSADYPAAMWHCGYVNRGRQWLSVEEVTSQATSSRILAAYLSKRESALDTLAGNLALADWCRDHRMADRERAHLTRVLELNPNYADARLRLGFRQVDGVWRSPEEIAETIRRGQTTAAALAEWGPRMEELIAGLSSQGQQRRAYARQKLLALKDPAVIPAIERWLCGGTEEQALLAVEMIQAMEGEEASLALARQAVFSSHESAAEAAALSLKTRDPMTYIPVMLASMSAPIQARAQLFSTPQGRLTYRQLLYRESQNAGTLAVMDVDYGRGRNIDAFQQADASVRTGVVGLAVAEENAAIEQMNQHIAKALSLATGQNDPKTAEDWWQWWNDENEVYMPDEKPVALLRQQTRVPSVSVASISADCLAAGTPVWTEMGPVVIEKVRVGDLVLAQHPDTGELNFKAVLRITHRAPEPLIRFDIGGEQITTSGGHVFWASGEGWIKARKLTLGMPLHRAQGTAPIQHIEPADPLATYNLVVADFHTFFVGEAQLLTHDNTIREPTDRIVPGLKRPF